MPKSQNKAKELISVNVPFLPELREAFRNKKMKLELSVSSLKVINSVEVSLWGHEFTILEQQKLFALLKKNYPNCHARISRDIGQGDIYIEEGNIRVHFYSLGMNLTICKIEEYKKAKKAGLLEGLKSFSNDTFDKKTFKEDSEE
jgi:hypothetical protein